jgi:hypothetical protein
MGENRGEINNKSDTLAQMGKGMEEVDKVPCPSG